MKIANISINFELNCEAQGMTTLTERNSDEGCSITVKKNYCKPALKHFGSVSALTMAGSGAQAEGGSGSKNKKSAQSGGNLRTFSSKNK